MLLLPWYFHSVDLDLEGYGQMEPYETFYQRHENVRSYYVVYPLVLEVLPGDYSFSEYGHDAFINRHSYVHARW